MPVLPSSALADPCWSLAHGRLNPFRCRVELSAVTRLEHEVDCACGCRRIDILQPCPVGSPPPTGPGGARRSHDHRTDQRHPVKSFRSAPRCRSPQHARRREVPSRSTGPTTSATSDPIAQLGMSRRAGLHLADDPYRPGCRAESPDPLTRARAHADAVRENAPGCHQPIVVHRRWRHTRTGRRRQRRRPARIPTPCSPRFPVNDRTPGTALAVYLAGTGRGRRHQTHDGRRRVHLEGPSCFQSDGRRGDGNKSSIRQPK